MSSAIIPNPEGRFSKYLMGQGFTMSKNLKKTNPVSKTGRVNL